MNIISKGIFALATAATSLMATQAQATVNAFFTAGGTSPGAGYTVVQNFNTPANAPYGLTGAYTIHAGSPNDNNGTSPNNGSSPYLAILGGNSATYTFATAAKSIQFDWGTASADNTLTFLTTTGNFAFNVPNSTSPDGLNYEKNGLLTATTNDGLITGLTFAAVTNSFEIDNIAASVPEPASWLMMIAGFGLVGSGMRSRRRVVQFA